MPSETPSESPRQPYDTCDPAFLAHWLTESAMDCAILARKSCLSLAQIRELQKGEGKLFYSDAIRRQAYKRLLSILGAPPPTAAMPEGEPTEPTQLGGAQAPHPWARRLVVLGMGCTLSGIAAWYWPHAVTPRTAHAATPVPATEPAAASSPAQAAAMAPMETVPAVAAVESEALVDATCAYSSGPMPQITPAHADKAGRYVYLVSPTATTLCVVDGSQQATEVPLNAGEGKSIYGHPPWQLSGENLQRIQVYFQGSRVTIPAEASQRVTLLEKVLPP